MYQGCQPDFYIYIITFLIFSRDLYLDVYVRKVERIVTLNSASDVNVQKQKFFPVLVICKSNNNFTKRRNFWVIHFMIINAYHVPLHLCTDEKIRLILYLFILGLVDIILFKITTPLTMSQGKESWLVILWAARDFYHIQQHWRSGVDLQTSWQAL